MRPHSDNAMKSLMTLFVCLLGLFLGSWAYRVKTPINRPDEYAEGVNEDAGNWLERKASKKVDDEWILDASLPPNYLPVPGQENLYMVVDNDGKILKYKKRTKQIDGTWTYEDYNPDIPEDYIPVEGLENVYMVKNPDGSTAYFKYIRNEDDTYAWVPVDEHGEYLGKSEDATVIDGKHVHITGNIYELLDDNGVVIGYDKRIQDADGKFKWVETLQPDLDSISADWKKKVEEAANKKHDDDTDYAAQYESEKDNVGNGIVNSTPPSLSTGDVNISMGDPAGSINVTPDTVSVINNEDGTHTETRVIRETKTIDGWTSTYETRIENVYDSSGELLSSRTSEPTEVDRHQALSNDSSGAKPVSEADRSKKEDTVDKETVRVASKIEYDDATAAEIVNLLNAERSKNGLQALQQTQLATSIAKLRAADMLTYDYTEKDLPTYGTLSEMLNEYDVSSSAPGETLYKTAPRSAYDINTRFQVDDNARKTRQSAAGTQVGIAIAKGNGCVYICEVVL